MAIVGYLIRRLLTGLVVVWLVATLTFFLFFARPVYTVARQMAGHAATPQVIQEAINNLGLNKPIYTPTSSYGHFGREPDASGAFSWERTDLADALRRAF